MVGNCQTCGELAVLVRGICPRCLRGEDELFEKIREILHREPGLGIDGLSELTGAKPEVILRLIEEGRLLLQGETRLFCAGCHKPIAGGRFCPACLQRLGKGLGLATPGKKSEGMYIRMNDVPGGRGGGERRK